MGPELPSDAEKLASVAERLPAFSGFSLYNLRVELIEALAHFGRGGIFHEYTKHDISHIDGLIQRYESLIPDDTKSIMSTADWLLTVLAGYLHDFGLLVTEDEYSRRAETAFPNYKNDLMANQGENQDYLSFVESLDTAEADKFLYQEFVRKNHALRVKGWIVGKPDARLGYDQRITDKLSELLRNLNSTFLKDLALVCESHHLDDLEDTARYRISRPYGDTAAETANVQYAAILLRAADLLHITQDRTPSMAFIVINPKNPVSQLEWAKQRAVRSVRPKTPLDTDGNVDENALSEVIEVHATFTNADGYFGLTNYLQYASQELQACNKWAVDSNKRFSVKHQFPWRKIDTDNVEAEGFVAEPFEFQIDQYKILDLLTGHTLYNDTNVVVRELVQNAIDAVRLQEEISEDSSYVPHVKVIWNPKLRELTVIDNGTGMTQDVIVNNFLRVGSSRYSEAKFIRNNPAFSPISRFGIGVLSAFMIADDVQVVTVSDAEDEARHLTLRTVHGSYLIRLLDKTSSEISSHLLPHGTSVKLHLRSSAKIGDVLDILQHWIVVPRCTVTFDIVGGESDLPVGYENVYDALLAIMLEHGIINQKPDSETGLVSKSGNPVRLERVEKDGLSLSFALQRSHWFDEWEFMEVSTHEESRRPYVLGGCVEGIRVSRNAPGFQRSNIWAISNSVGKSAPRTNVARNSFESTKEYRRYIDDVYTAYMDHVRRESEAILETKRVSLTKVANDLKYMLRPLVSSHRPAEPEIQDAFEAALKDLPVYLVETGGRRHRLSYNDLGSYDSLSTVESTLTRHMEYVLGAVPTSTSRADFLKAVGETNDTHEGEAILCSSLESAPFGAMFINSWEPSQIYAEISDRRIKAIWKTILTDVLWSLPDERFRLQNRFGLSGRPSGYMRFPMSSKLQFDGLEEYTAFRMAGGIWLLPSNPLLLALNHNLDDGLSTVDLLAFAVEIESDFFRDRLSDAQASRVAGYLSDSDAGRSINAESLTTALLTWDQNMFNVNRWERDSGGR